MNQNGPVDVEESDMVLGRAPILTLRGKVAALGVGLVLLGIISSPKISVNPGLSDFWIAASLILLSMLILSVNMFRSRIINDLSVWRVPSDGLEAGYRFEVFRLVLLVFGFMGFANVMAFPLSLSPSNLFEWSGPLFLGLCQIVIGFSGALRTSVSWLNRKAAGLCLIAGLWAIFVSTWIFLGHEPLLWFYRSGLPSINFEVLQILIIGSFNSPLISGVLSWIFLVFVLGKLIRSREEGNFFDLSSFLQSLWKPVGIYLCFTGVLLIPMVLWAFIGTDVAPSFVPIIIFSLYSAAALLLGPGLIKKQDPFYSKRRVTVFLFLGIILVGFFPSILILQEWSWWGDFPLLLRFQITRMVLSTVTLLTLLATLLIIYRAPEKISTRSTIITCIILGLIFSAGLLTTILI